MTVQLQVHQSEGVKLADALAAFTATIPAGERHAVALLYAPAWCRFAVLRKDGSLAWSSKGQPADLASVFEARVFHAEAELRWWNDPSALGKHRLAVLADVPLDGTLKTGPQPIFGVLEGETYLLWGEGLPSDPREPDDGDGWSRLGTARIGTLDVPLPGIDHKKRARLVSKEYLVERDHGNVVVLDERLVRLELEPEQENGR
jgi:CRISPR-associated protein (TIGR03984 family)